MLFYHTLYFSLFFFCLFDRKSVSLVNKKVLLYLLCVVYAFIGGYGYWNGTDWNNYYELFQKAKWNNIFSTIAYNDVLVEPGYMFLNVFFKTTLGSFTNFMFVTTLIYLIVATNVILKRTNYPILTFTTFFFSKVQFLMIRQQMAIIFLIIAIIYIEKRKLCKFLICVICASLIHRFALSFSLMYFLPLLIYKPFLRPLLFIN